MYSALDPDADPIELQWQNLNLAEAVLEVVRAWWDDLVNTIENFIKDIHDMGYKQVDHRGDTGFSRADGDDPYTYLLPGTGDSGMNPAGFEDWSWAAWLGNAWREILWHAHLDLVWDEIVIIYNRGYERRFDEDADPVISYVTPDHDDYDDQDANAAWMLDRWFINTWKDLIYHFVPGLDEYLNDVFIMGYKQVDHRKTTGFDRSPGGDTPYTYITDDTDGEYEDWSFSAWLGNAWRETLYWARLDLVWDEIVIIYNRGYKRKEDKSTTPSTITYIDPDHDDYDASDDTFNWSTRRWFENTWLDIIHWFAQNSIGDYLVRIYNLGYTQSDNANYDPDDSTTDRYSYDTSSTWSLHNWFPNAWNEIIHFFGVESIWNALLSFGASAWESFLNIFNMGFVQEAHGEDDPDTPTTYTYITEPDDADNPTNGWEAWDFGRWITNAATRLIGDITQTLNDWWEDITTAADSVWMWITDNATAFLSGVIKALTDFGKASWDSLLLIWNRGYTRSSGGSYDTTSTWTISKWITNVILDAGTALRTWFDGLSAFGTGLTTALGTWFDGLDDFGTGLTDALNDWFDDLDDFGEGLTDALNDWFDDLDDFGAGLTDALNTWWSDTVQAAGTAWEWIATNASDFISGVINALHEFGKASWDNLVKIWNRGYDRMETNGVVSYDTNSTWTISKWFGNIIRDSYVALNTWWTGTIQAVGSVWEWIHMHASEFLTGVINAIVGVGETLWGYLIDSEFFLWGYDYHPTIVNEDGTTGGYVTPDNVDRLVDYDGDGSWNITHFVSNLMRLAGGAINDAWLALVDLGKVSLVTLKRIGSDIWLAIEHIGDFLWSKIQGFFALGYNRDSDGTPITDDTEMGFGWSLGNLINNLVGELTDSFVTFTDTLYTSLRNLAYIGFDYSSDIKAANPSDVNAQKNAVDYSMPLEDQFDVDSTWTWGRFWSNLIELTDDFLEQFAGDMWLKLKDQIVTIASDVWGQITSGIGSFAEGIWKGLQIGVAYADEEETTPTAESERRRQVLRDFAEFFKIDAGSKKLDMNTYDIENVDRILFKTNDGINPDLEFSYWTGKNENLDSASDDPNRGLFGFIREGDAEFAIHRRVRNDGNTAWISKVLLSVNKTTSSIHSPFVVSNPERTADVTSVGAFYKKWDTAGDDDTVDIWVYTKEGARRLSDIVGSGTSGDLTVGGRLTVNGSTILGKNDNHDVVIKAGYLYFQTDYDGVRAEDGNNGIIWKDDNGNVKLISGGVERNLSNVVPVQATPSLSDLTDTDIEDDDDIADGEVLAWDAGNDKWENRVINLLTNAKKNVLDQLSWVSGTPDYINVASRMELVGKLRAGSGFELRGGSSSGAVNGDMWLSGNNVVIRSGNKSVTIAPQTATTVAKLANIGDVSTTAASDDQVLQWNDTNNRWEPATISVSALTQPQINVLNQLSWVSSGDILNVTAKLEVEGVLQPEAGISLRGDAITSPENGDIWIDGSNVHIQSGGNDVTIAPATSGSISELSDIGDVSTTTPSDDQVLAWDTDEWVPTTLSTGALTTPQQNVLNQLSWVSGTPNYINVASRMELVGKLRAGSGFELRGGSSSGAVNGDMWLSGNDVVIRSGNDNVTIALGGAATVASLNDIDNVNAPSPADDQVLSWDSSSSKWIPATVATGSVSELSDIGDVSTTAPDTGQVLTWGGSTWGPADAAGGGALTAAQAEVLAELSFATSTGITLGTSGTDPTSLVVTGGLKVAASATFSGTSTTFSGVVNLNGNVNTGNGLVQFNNDITVGGVRDPEDVVCYGNVRASGYTQVGYRAGTLDGHIWYDSTAEKLKARVDGNAVDISTGGGSGGSANVAQGFTDKALSNSNGFWIPVVQADLTYANCDANFGNHNGAMGIIVTTTSSLSTSAINLCWKIRNTWYYKNPDGSISGEQSGKRYTELIYTKKAMFPEELYSSASSARTNTPTGNDRWSIWGDAGTRRSDDSGIMIRRNSSGSAIADFAEMRSDGNLGNNSGTPSSRPDASYSFVGSDLESLNIRLPTAQQLSDFIGYDDGYIGFNRATLQVCVRVNIWWTFNNF